MSFLLDTNVVSEWVKPRPDARVIAWLAEIDEDRVFLSVLTFAEIKRGVDLLPAGRRRERLGAWLFEELPGRFEGRILTIDSNVALAWGALMANSQRAGASLSAMDAFFAATCMTCGFTLVTRNLRDFESTGITLFDPWQSHD